MSLLSDNYQKLLDDVRALEREAGREPGAVEILAVSKRQSAAAIESLAALGQRQFGENYLQEATEKIAQLAALELEWHFIGQLQSNKTASVASLFDWVHTLDREKIARRLSEQRPPESGPLNVCIQVNISEETTKGGVPPGEVRGLAEIVRSLPGLQLRGLMALPAPAVGFTAQRQSFAALRRCYLDSLGGPIDTLSMGTSGDYQAAIHEGATMIRIGTMLFGERRE